MVRANKITREAKVDRRSIRRMIGRERFLIPAKVGATEADVRFRLIESLWRDHETFCQSRNLETSWTPLVKWIADEYRRGQRRINLPPPEVLRTVAPIYWRGNEESVWLFADTPTLDSVEVVFDYLCVWFPSVAWSLPTRQIFEIAQRNEGIARAAVEKMAKVEGQKPPSEDSPVVLGKLHEAIEKYMKHAERDVTDSEGRIDQSGHYRINLISSLLEYLPDMPLSSLDLQSSQELFDVWRKRPISSRTKKPLSRKGCNQRLRETKNFLDWLHLGSDFAWRKPEDFEYLKTSVRKADSDRKPLLTIEKPMFTVEELATLAKHADLRQRLALVWCLNCSHGAAEFGRAEWQDVFLRQPHPWKPLEYGSDADSWIGFLRPKTDVIGWWWLFPETVELLEKWREHLESGIQRTIQDSERIVLTSEGTSLYRDFSKNSQSGFATIWSRLHSKIRKSDDKVKYLPFGSLRDHLSNWLAADKGEAVLGSVALAHGIPHEGDDLLFGKYSNRPWRLFFDAQREWREYLEPVLAVVRGQS